MLAPTHRSFSLPATVCGIAIMSKVSESMYQGGLWQQSLPIIVTVVTAWIVSPIPDWDRYIPFMRHRGWTHAIWIPLLLLWGTFQIQTGSVLQYICFGAFCGWFSHILGDAFSTAGVALLYPFISYETYASGAFTVKGFRGPFIPIYRTGEKTFISMRLVWYAIGIALFMCYISYLSNLDAAMLL